MTSAPGRPAIHAFWCRIPSRANFGDALTPWLIRRIAGADPVFVRTGDPRPKLIAVGSTIAYAARGDTVWGAGIMSATDPVSPGARFLAVRGPLTRARVLACGAECPEIYGDPALLLPRLHRPPAREREGIGLVAHYSDRPRLGEAWGRTPGVRPIDIQGRVEAVIDQIVASRVVASSSLHGLIVSHAYGVPAVWIKFRDLAFGDDSKFRDYYLSVGEPPPAPVPVAYDRADPDVLAARATLPAGRPDLDRLWSACPFRGAV
jgi:hypothetical protein